LSSPPFSPLAPLFSICVLVCQPRPFRRSLLALYREGLFLGLPSRVFFWQVRFLPTPGLLPAVFPFTSSPPDPGVGAYVFLGPTSSANCRVSLTLRGPHPSAYGCLTTGSRLFRPRPTPKVGPPACAPWCRCMVPPCPLPLIGPSLYPSFLLGLRGGLWPGGPAFSTLAPFFVRHPLFSVVFWSLVLLQPVLHDRRASFFRRFGTLPRPFPSF